MKSFNYYLTHPKAFFSLKKETIEGPSGRSIRKIDGETYIRTIYGDNIKVTSTARLLSYARNIGLKVPEYKFIPHLGIELELCGPEDDRMLRFEAGYIQDIGRDGSVRPGVEIRFNHFTLKSWLNKNIKPLLNKARAQGFFDGKNASRAGMHIHYSHPKGQDIIRQYTNNIGAFQRYLEALGGRHADHGYGFRGDSYRNQLDCFGTFELRVFSSILDEELIKQRLIFMDSFCKFLLNNGTPDKFIQDMPNEGKEAMLFMLNHPDNPHKYGMNWQGFIKEITDSLVGSSIDNLEKRIENAS